MKCSALFVLDNPFYFIVFVFYVVLGGFWSLIPNDLQCNYQKLKSNFCKCCSKSKNENKAQERNKNKAKKDLEAKLKQEMKTKFLSLFYHYFQIMN